MIDDKKIVVEVTAHLAVGKTFEDIKEFIKKISEIRDNDHELRIKIDWTDAGFMSDT